MKKALITGITGFAGSHLAEYLLSQNKYEISGIHSTDRHLDNVTSIKDKVELTRVDLNDAGKTAEVIQKQKPDVIFHLAASAIPGDSFSKAADFITNNSTAQINIFEAVKESKLFDTKIIIISSSHVYGLVASSDLPIDENVQFKPDNPYAVSKITQDYLGLCYYLTYKLPIIRLRPFNHLGPRLSPGISISRFAKQIAEIEKGKIEPVLTVGNLSAKRDFTDVHDMVRAYALASEKCLPGEAYNIGTGVSYTIQELLDKLLSSSSVKITVKTDETLLRPSDNPELRADASKFKQATGWEPEVAIDKTLKDILDYWREIV
jgi:GDP-4-dehydro-6-deoxy-D-mannose reductase